MSTSNEQANQLTARSIRNLEALKKQENNNVEENQLTARSAAEAMDEFNKNNREAIEIAWTDLHVTANEGEKTIISGAAGKIHGSFLAIMGPSGSGKSTLMNVLACRAKGIDHDGVRIINGANYSLTELKQIAGYVMQDDLLNGRLTVEETLWYTAELRLPRELSRAEKERRIEDVLGKLGLTHVRDTIIGDHMHRGISGGERKRVCVAMELLLKPRLLFLDEPTSGLDSVTASALCTILRELAHSGECTVITTIHQPQSKIFRMFDELILLKTGRIVYYGKADEVEDFFSEAGYPCPPKTNPADHILDVITYNPGVEGSKESVEEAANRLRNMRKEENMVDLEDKERAHANKVVHMGRRVPWTYQFMILFHRSFKQQIRAWDINLTLVLQNFIMAILIGGAFWQIGNGQDSNQKRLPVIFFCVINQGIFGAMAMINSFPKERVLVLRERAAGTYQASAYFLAKNVAESFIQLISPIMFSCIVYFMIGFQNDAGKFFVFTGFMVLTTFAAISLALLISAIGRTTDMAVTILPLVMEVCRLFGGFFLPPAKLPVYFSWLDALSYVKYAYPALAYNQLQGLVLTCADNELVNGRCPVTSGETLIQQQKLDWISVEASAAILVVYIVLCRVIAYLGVRYIKW